MLHSKKSHSIVQWYNSLTAKGSVNSLEQFADGSYFYEIVVSLKPFLLHECKEDNLATEAVIFSETSIACNEEVTTSVEEEATEGKMETSISEIMDDDPFVVKEPVHTDTQKKYDDIRKFIDDVYNVESSSLINYEECQKGKEIELAKVAVFLLSAMVQTYVSSKNELVYTTTCLDLEVQENIHECLTLVLGDNVAENQIKKSELHKVLSRAATYKGTPVRKSSRSISDPNDSLEGGKNIFKRRKERQSVGANESQNSPLKNLLDSPKIYYKVAMLKKDSELAKLRSALHNEENKVMDLTSEKENLYAELEKKRKELEFYKKELQSQREALIEKEEQEKLADEKLSAKKIETEKLKKLIESQEEEMKHLKEINETLQEKVVDLEKKLGQDATSFLVKENNHLKAKIQVLELDNEEKDQTVNVMKEKIIAIENELQKYQEFSASISRRELRSSNVHETLSTIIYADEHRETLEKKEQELGQDLEIKDERIKRLAFPQCKGETSKNKNSNYEELQKKVDHLNGCMSKLEDENRHLKKTLENYIQQCNGETSKNKNSNFEELQKEVERLTGHVGRLEEENNHMKKKLETFELIRRSDLSSKIESAIGDDRWLLVNFCEDPQLMDQGRIGYLKLLLKKLIKHLSGKNCFLPDSDKKLIQKLPISKSTDELVAVFRDLVLLLEASEAAVTTRSRSFTAEEVNANSPIKKTRSLELEKKSESEPKSFRKKPTKTKEELSIEIKNLEVANAALMVKNDSFIQEVANLKQKVADLAQEAAIAQEKYINMKMLAKKKDYDVKKVLQMYEGIQKLNKKDKESKKECDEECEKLRRRCKQLNQECLDLEQETGELKRSIKHLEGMMEHLQFEIKELNEEKKELKHKLWKETAALSRNTSDRDALVLHYLKKSKHEPKKNKDAELKREQKSSRPIVKVDAYILNSENEPSTSTSILASRSIRSSCFQLDDEADFLNESSLAEIHNGGIPEGENRLHELQRRNTLCPPHLQSSYPLEIQNMTPSERKYYNPDEASFDLGRKSFHHKKTKSKCRESDSDESDDTPSIPVKKRKISEAHHVPAPVSKKHYQLSSNAVPGTSKDHEIPRKPSTPLKRVAAFVKRRSSTFITPSSVNRLMKLQRKSKRH